MIDTNQKNSKYPYRYNALLAQNLSKYGEDRVWDVAITGQVGGKAWKANTEILQVCIHIKDLVVLSTRN